MERRQGKFRRNRLKLKDGNRISLPSGTELFYWFPRKLRQQNTLFGFESVFSLFSSSSSAPDFQHKITVQASPSHDRRRSLLSSGSSPQSSPPILPRLRAIQRKKSLHVTLSFISNEHLMLF